MRILYGKYLDLSYPDSHTVIAVVVCDNSAITDMAQFIAMMLIVILLAGIRLWCS